MIVHMERALRCSGLTINRPDEAIQTPTPIWKCEPQVRSYRSICTAVLYASQRFDQASGDAGWQSELAVASYVIVISA